MDMQIQLIGMHLEWACVQMLIKVLIEQKYSDAVSFAIMHR